MMSYDRKASGGTEPAERARWLGTMHMLAGTEAAVDLVSLIVTRSGTLQQRGGGFRAEPSASCSDFVRGRSFAAVIVTAACD